jgi:2-polyprenyl-3-methyl-5-hydroxy-6-metoxy-1,4-benzoquinol methylase
MDTDQLFNLPKLSFDAITLWHVLEHVHDLHHYMEQLSTLLKPNGKIFIAVPNYKALDASVYGPFWAAYDVPRHLYHFTPQAIESLIRQHGLQLVNKKPMWFDSFYISMLSSKYHSGKTKLISSFLNGLRSNVKAALDKDRCSSITYIIAKH